MTRLAWSFWGIIVILAYAVGVLIMCESRVPYASHAPWTEQERQAVKKAIHKIGRHTIITGEREIVIRLEAGGTRTIRRKGI